MPGEALRAKVTRQRLRAPRQKAIRESLKTTYAEASVLIITATVTLLVDLIWGIGVGIVAHFVAKLINKGR